MDTIRGWNHSCARRRRLLHRVAAGCMALAVAAGAGRAFAAEDEKDVADMDLSELANVRVSPFDVSTTGDRGYYASSSVSASRIDAPINELPFAIQAFTGAFIEDQKPVNLFDVARYSPGVTYRSNDFNEGNANLAIRGFTVGSLAGGNIQVLRDGFHGPSIFEFTNIARVEVVKGPASFLYGQVAPGGIVNIITKSPQPEYAATAKATYGSYGQYRLEADVTGPAGKTLFYRVAASYGEDIDYWDPYSAYSWDVAPSLLWQPTERVSVSLKFEHFSKREDPPVMQKPGYNTQTGVVPTPGDPNLSGVDVPGLPDNWNSMSFADYRHSDTDGLSTWVDFQLDDHWNVRAAYSFQAYDIDAVFSGNLGMSSNSTFLQGRRYRGQDYKNRDHTGEVQAVGKYQLDAISLRLLVGGEYVDRSFDAWAAQAPNDPALGNDPIGSPLPLWDLRDPATWNRVVSIPRLALTESPASQGIESVDKSVYAGMTLGFSEDRLLALAGARVTTTESRYVNHVTPAANLMTSDDAVTPQCGLLYKATPELSLFASYAESFVPGVYPLTGAAETKRAPKPTQGRGFDLGLKADLFGGRVSTTLTVFEIRNENVVNDLATTDSTGAVRILNVQSGEQRSRGVEWDATITAVENWQVYLSYSYMDAKITEFSGNDAAILAQDWTTLDAAGRANYKNVLRFHDAPLQMSAPHLANLWTRYNFKSGALDGAYVGGGVNFVYDQTILPDTPESAYQTYTLVNAVVGYSWDWQDTPVSLELMGRNLTGEYYRPSQSTRSRPRELLLTFTARF